MTIRLDKQSSRSGVTILLMLFMLVIVFIFVAFAIDVGRIQLAQLKLQTAADFASRAGAEAMSRGLASDGEQFDLAALETAIRDEADMLMRENSLFGAPVTFDSNAQITFGFSNSDDGQVLQPLGNGGGGNGNGNGNAGGNGKGNSPLHGNGKKKFKFTPSTSGLTIESNSINVNPDIAQFPLVFGTFLGTESVALRATSTAKIEDRDIVVVLDKSDSMLKHDAGSLPVGEYNANLLAVEDALYSENDDKYTTDNPIRHTEFENNDGILNLSRMQALKLAMLNFRESIDRTPSQEKLGLVTYAGVAWSPGEVTQATPNSAIDIVAGLTTLEFDAIVDDHVTDRDEQEIAASALELVTEDGNYPNFDFNYLRMRWGGRTHIADGIKIGAETLFGAGHRNSATPIMIVLTDGRHNQEGTPEEAAAAAMALHPDMLIYTITFGAGAEEGPMITVADIGNGRHVHANDVNDLIEVFEELAANAGVALVE